MGTEHSGNLEPASKCPKLGDLVVHFSRAGYKVKTPGLI